MGTDRATLLDIAKAQDPNGAPALIIEILSQMNPILQDAPAYASNAKMAERTTLRSSLPTVQFAQLNKGTVRSKGSYRQVVDTIGFLDGMSEVDCRLQKIEGEAAIRAYRDAEDKGFLEALNQKVALTMLYGDELYDPQSFTGLAPRLTTTATAITGSQVKSMGSVTGSDGTSIYVVDWGRQGAHITYPMNGTGVAGVESRDLGEIRVNDADSNPLMAYVTQYNWLVGLAVKDPRHIARLANIDISDAGLEFPTQGTLWNALTDVITGMPSPMGMQRVLYTHRNIEAAFWKQAQNKSNNLITTREYLGEPVAHFRGWPIRSLDQMSAAESTVS